EYKAQSSYFVYDALGRERFVVNRANSSQTAPTGYASERQYDAAGNVVLERAYGFTIPYEPGQSEAAIAAALAGSTDAQSRETHYVYDRLGRLRFTMDDNGVVVEQQFDAMGRVVKTIQYAQAISQGTAKTEAAVSAAVN